MIEQWPFKPRVLGLNPSAGNAFREVRDFNNSKKEKNNPTEMIYIPSLLWNDFFFFDQKRMQGMLKSFSGGLFPEILSKSESRRDPEFRRLPKFIFADKYIQQIFLEYSNLSLIK
jgi:hypothetical protein